jgi:hypothetical protein
MACCTPQRHELQTWRIHVQEWFSRVSALRIVNCDHAPLAKAIEAGALDSDDVVAFVCGLLTVDDVPLRKHVLTFLDELVGMLSRSLQ